MSKENFKLDREIDAAKLLRASLADILEGDEQLSADTVEGQTNINEAIQAAAVLYCQDKVAVEAIKAHVAIMQARSARLKRRMEMTRTLVATALEVAGRKSVETALGNATLRHVAPGVIIDKEREDDIPLEYWGRGDPVLDKKKLKDDLESGKQIKGARLDNGGMTVTFTFR